MTGETTTKPGSVAFAGLVRHIGMVGIAGVMTGIVIGGVGGRIFMRIAGANAPVHARGARTEAGFRVGEITLGGTLELIIFVGIFSGILGAIAHVVSEPWLAWAGKWRGLAFGLLLLVTASSVSDAIEPSNFDFRILDHAALNVLLISLLFLAFGVMVVWVLAKLEGRLGPVNSARPMMTALPFVPLVALGTLGALTGFFPIFFSEEACGCDPQPVIGAFLIAMAVATLLLWLNRHTARFAQWTTQIRLLGFAALLGAFVAGAIHFVSDVAEIV